MEIKEKNRAAYETKEEGVLAYRIGNRVLHLAQDLSGDDTTGSTLWLSAQVLAAYVQQNGLRDRNKGRRKCLELGSGVGLVGLALAGDDTNDVLLTDVDKVVDRVLLPNVEMNGHRNAQVGVLDWHTDADSVDWKGMGMVDGSGAIEPPFDLIVSTDTLYERTLTPLLLQHIHYHLDRNAHCKALIGLERRDSTLIDEALSMMAEMGLKVQQIAHESLSRAVRDEYGWEDDEMWSGCEVYKLTKSSKRVRK